VCKKINNKSILLTNYEGFNFKEQVGANRNINKASTSQWLFKY